VAHNQVHEAGEKGMKEEEKRQEKPASTQLPAAVAGSPSTGGG